MNWIAIGVIAGSIITSGHADKEACLGRVAMLKEQKVEAICVETPRSRIATFSGSNICYLRGDGTSSCR